jgi:hypothetical protein
MNNNLLISAETWLNELGVRTERTQTTLKVSTSDIVMWDENNCLILEMKKAISPKLYWGEVVGEWRHLNSF